MSELTDSLDDSIEDLRQAFINAQESFFYVYGRYWQGRMTHADIPADGKATPITDLDSKPSSEPFGWRQFAAYLPADMKAALLVENYDGPSGKGFTVAILAVENGDTLCRILNHGPETRREKGWFVSIKKEEGETI